MRNAKKSDLRFGATLAAALVVGLGTAAIGAAAASPAPTPQKTFDTPKQAADALIQAAAANDTSALMEILGPDSKDIISSGDPVEDKNAIAKFAEGARAKTQIVVEPGNPKKATLVVGNDDYPMPIPIVQSGSKWRFDSQAGREEILTRRIGLDELAAITFLRGYVEAQKEYASEVHDGSGIHQYAQKIISTPGKHDGLSWWSDDHKPAGPIGDAIAKAMAEGYTTRGAPYNGYYFKFLTAQGASAPNGARDYIVKGVMVGGFAALAWPANYGVTGVQTFQVSHDGIVYQKDLGDDTAKLAAAIARYDPDKSWAVTEDAP
jgi:hypothetical protein